MNQGVLSRRARGGHGEDFTQRAPREGPIITVLATQFGAIIRKYKMEQIYGIDLSKGKIDVGFNFKPYHLLFSIHSHTTS